MHFDIVRLSSKGQLVIPGDVRKRLGLRRGAKLALFADGKHILLKPVPAPDISAFSRMVINARNVMDRAKAGRNIASG
ncbi:MAG: AbrB/MazE/SpoVT family DNA-binding domain-containing protein [Kiritimatiellota bacterium]|nr:AbrB/MazE/SpoVT family DNA-binding domain-containing protein [Kiritimatiellota bacterium]